MKKQMAFITKTYTIRYIKSLFGILREGVYMVRTEFARGFVTLLASIIISTQNIVAPLLVRLQKSSPLYALGFWVVIPVGLSSQNRHHFIFTLRRACVFFSVWLIPHLNTTYIAIKNLSSFSKIVRRLPYMCKPILFYGLSTSFYSNIPRSRDSTPKVCWSQPWYIILHHIISDSSLVNLKDLGDNFWGLFLCNIQIFKAFFSWFHNAIYKKLVKKSICTASNTWVRAALTTW